MLASTIAKMGVILLPLSLFIPLRVQRKLEQQYCA